MAHRYITVDVFTDKIFEGAQIAIVPDAKDLSEETMQKMANEFNLWRTVFLLPPTNELATCAIRIFNPKKEFDYGGHATIGAIHALSILKLINTNEGENDFVINENLGDVQCSITIADAKAISHRVTSLATITLDHFVPTPEEFGDFLSVHSHHFSLQAYSPLLVASHVPYLFVPVDDVKTLSNIHFDYKAWTASSASGTFASSIFVFSETEHNGTPHFHCRLVGPSFGLHEDPPIAAAMPAFAAYLTEYKSAPTHFTAERGTFSGRKSELNVDIVSKESNTIKVNISGKAVLVSMGEIFN